ncbi:exonuclease domain-containing protein [Dyadobacter frigoris]|uniref:DNA polymerase III subunit epsilon n=1 Tax=Dyadobacter frigoris TaxID=2576211 RepID=A0A4U6D2S4_9BACT|nr:exonuclease domain-containing protein [Dyadobacter frigoris]TKT90625.1 DNA polymerase III subunit epsilon [Dyadobacter frigoris]GLU51225.1 exonuclease [Dyadobacter frigoris]
MNYAIVDIETTGSFASASGITEIAIRIHDGISVIDSYETLLNPGLPIPLSIQSLTGINHEMIKDSPAFSQKAAQIYQILSGCIFVAHNVNFDYSFVKHHLHLAGYELNTPKLCTVRLSRKIKPGLRSYSLGKLCDALGIPIQNRHRAGGDADATAILFEKLINWDIRGDIQAMLKKTSREQQLPPNLAKDNFMALPSCPGIYYFKDQSGKEIYVGKALDIKKRVSQHFTGHNPNQQRQQFLRNIFSISFEACGNELMALILEAAEIQRLWPLYNRALKRPESRFALYSYEDGEGFLRLVIGKHSKYQKGIHIFDREADGIRMLRKLVMDFSLNPGKCSYGYYPLFSTDSPEPGQIGTDFQSMSAKQYNDSVTAALNSFKESLPGFVIFDTGRNENEESCIWVEKGRLTGIGYVQNSDIKKGFHQIKQDLKPISANHYMMQMIFNFAAKNPFKVKIPDTNNYLLHLPVLLSAQ